jgi:hypothetical protein
MYCKTCGAENPSTANYCMNDGALLKSHSIGFEVKEKHSVFCSNCGTKAFSLSNYCQSCGESLFQYGRDHNVTPKLAFRTATPSGPVKLPAFKLDYLKKAIIPAILAIFIISLLSFSTMKSSENFYNNMLNRNMGNYNLTSMINGISSETNSDLPQPGKLVGITDVMMLANLQSPDITFKGSGGISFLRQRGSFHFLVQNGFLIYLLIPFIGLFAAGIFAGRKNQRTELSAKFYDAASIALLYSIVCTILSFFAGFSYHVNLNGNPGNAVVDIHTKYPFFKTFLMALLFGFIFSSLGILFSINFKKITGHLEEWIPSGRAIHQAIMVPFIGFLLLFVSFFIYLTSKFSDFKEQIGPELSGTPLAELLDKSIAMIAALSFQLGSYLWNLLHLAPLTLMVQETPNSSTGSGSISYSIFSGLTATGSAQNGVGFLESMLGATDIEMYLKFALLIPIVLFIWAGFRIAKQPNLLKNLLIFTIVYSMIMTGVAAFSDIGFNFSGNMAGAAGSMAMSLGFGGFGTFFRSLIFSFVFAYLGSWITKLKAAY